MNYKIIYHIGNEISIKTKAKSGLLSLKEQAVYISDSPDFELLYSSIISVEMIQINGLGSMIKIISSDQTIFLSVVRLNIAGYFAIFNFIKTCELITKIKAHLLL